MIRVLQFPAKSGDSVLFQIDDITILVDGGYGSTYEDYIGNFLLENGIELELVVCTHYDQDHIGGILPLIESFPHIKNVWYNGFFEMFNCDSSDHLTYPEKRKLVTDYSIVLEEFGKKKEISRKQGESLSILLKDRKDIIHNSGNGLVISNKESIPIQNDISVEVISPMLKDLNCLKTKWEKELEFSLKRKPNSMDSEIIKAFENYQLIQSSIDDNPSIGENISLSTSTIENLLNIEQPLNDTSIINKAAISFIIESKGVEFLYCSDSDDQTITNFLKQRSNRKFIGVKVSHHGSIRNNWTWIDYVESDKFFISTDGVQHDNHPSPNVLAKIANNNPGCTIYFNYNIPRIASFSDMFLKELNCQFVFPTTSNLEYITIRSSHD